MVTNDQDDSPLEHFLDLVAELHDPELVRPELLPERLAVATARALPVAGAGLSLHGDDLRIPVGASDESAALAERLQFTLGSGPCLEAYALGEPLLAAEPVIAKHWPKYHHDLVARTAFRSVASVPLHDDLVQIGVLDLFGTGASLHTLDLAVVNTVAEQICRLLVDAELSAEVGRSSLWLSNPAAAARNQVVQAAGIINVALELTAPRALSLLRAYSYRTERPVEATAQLIVDGVLLPRRLLA
ncbi:GAF and ANTAR domain-containing protein [Nakamurella leprariae]|uniref:GAF and ANTAR domain-containing protein n=1 Tax=Nakamurella leprariae TaxID=2803911 RepID=A0A939C284_9ACTN|nr:GAF and ANTAR domain-containing protein [Nakamurella leprariae]MBM9467949.1 GAF and ANTAR domain-containing protein [Nakamurella leprariae]